MTVTIAPVTTEDDLRLTRDLLRVYAAALGLDLSFQSFDVEMAGLPGEYAPPRGRLFLARCDDRVAGCIALRPIDTETCEMKRLYVRPEFRGRRIGRLLAERLIDEAHGAGYARMRLDTLPSMREAIPLYRSLGFRTIAPYRYNPVPGATFMELDLK